MTPTAALALHQDCLGLWILIFRGLGTWCCPRLTALSAAVQPQHQGSTGSGYRQPRGWGYRWGQWLEGCRPLPDELSCRRALAREVPYGTAGTRRGLSMGHRLSFPRDARGMAGLGRLPRATESSKNKNQAGVGLRPTEASLCQGLEPPLEMFHGSQLTGRRAAHLPILVAWSQHECGGSLMPRKAGMLSDDCVTHKATVPAGRGWGPVTRMSQPHWVTSSWSTENTGTPNIPGAQKQPQGSC